MLQVQKGTWVDHLSDGIWKLLWKIKAPPKALNLNIYGVGIIARDCTRILLEAKMKLFPGDASPELAEAMTIKEALSWSMRWEEKKVVIESDCLVAVQAIRSRIHMRSQFGKIIMECRSYMSQLNNVELYFIKRSANMAAHKLARASHIYPDRSFDRWSVPIKVKQCIADDLIS
ncbi:hypothetical protein AgCh_004316 [Apium graveolens]